MTIVTIVAIVKIIQGVVRRTVSDKFANPDMEKEFYNLDVEILEEAQYQPLFVMKASVI